MSFKTFKNYFSIDDINISFSTQENLSNSLYITFPEFRNLTIFSKKPNITKIDVLDILDKYINPDYFKMLKKNSILNDEESQYVVNNIFYKKFFSEFLPEIPLINIIRNDNVQNNKMIFYKEHLIGIIVDNETILPIVILFNIIKNLILNNGIFIFDNNLNYDIIETIDNENKNQHFFLILNESIKFNTQEKKFKLSGGDIILNINGNNFNKNGKIYCDKLKLFLSINLYVMIQGQNQININFLPKSKFRDDININCINTKHIILMLETFKQNMLKIPILGESKFKFKNLEFGILTEEIMEKYFDCPLSKKHFEKNHMSKHKYVVLTNHESGRLYILEKVSNKNIKSLDEMINYISKNDNKKTFYFNRINDTLKIIV